MLKRLRYSSSLVFLRFILCAVISLIVLVGNSISVMAGAKWTYKYTTSGCNVSGETFVFSTRRSDSNTATDIGSPSDGMDSMHYKFRSNNYTLGSNVINGDVLRFDMPDVISYVVTYNESDGVADLRHNTYCDVYLCVNGERFLMNGNNQHVIVENPTYGTISWYWEIEFNSNYFLTCNKNYNSCRVDYKIDVTIPYMFVYYSTYDEIYGGDSSGVVTEIEKQTEQQKQDSQAQLEATEKQNDLQEEANETSKGIFDKISDFFNGFFENITNTTSGLFIPEDGYFEGFFVRMNDFFAEKLGALYAPIDMFISIMNGILGAGNVTPGIPFPGLKWDDTYIIEPTTVSFDTFYEQFPGLQDKIYFATDVILVGSVIWLLQVKLREVLAN